VRVQLVALGALPPRLAPALLAGLPAPPFVGVEAATQGVSIEGCHDRSRGQSDAACLLALVPAPPAGWLTLGLTSVDLFLPPLAYVFGLSPVGGGRALVSCARLAEKGDGPQAWETLFRRALIESVHELGHAMGLVHCDVTECAMHRSLWPEAVDLKRAEYCAACAAELAEMIEARDPER
jgi:archaemetzincin